MLKRFLSELVIPLEIVAEGPILVRSGFASVEIPEDLAPVVTVKDGIEQPLIPGSSLKGVLRSHAERIMRTLSSHEAVCDPFGNNSCGRRLQSEAVPDAHAHSCPACRLFGSTAYASRFSIDDAYIKPGTKWTYEKRDGVGIDRFTGGAVDRFKFELVAVGAGATWETTVRVRNFECWQLGLVLVVLKDLQDGFVRIGSGTRRGLGAVRGVSNKIELHVVSREQPPAHEIWGIGRWLGDGSYGTYADDVLRVTESLRWERAGLRWKATITADALHELQEVATAEFVRRLERWPSLARAEVSRR